VWLCGVLSLLVVSTTVMAQERGAKSEAAVRAYLQERNIDVTQHNSLKLFFSGHDKFADLFSHINQAEKTIHMEYFNFRNDSIAGLTFELLGEKAQQGVKVRAMYDAFGNSSNNQPLKKVHNEAIRATGVDLVEFDPIRFPWVNHIVPRDHRKIVVIDGKTGYTGGMNIADYYVVGLEEIGEWHDIHMRLEGPVVSKLQDIFVKMWNKETKQHVLTERRTEVVDMTAERTPVVDKPESEVAQLPLEERIELVGQRTHEEVDIAIVDRAPGKTSDAIRRVYAKALDSAEEHVQIVNPYFVPTKSVRRAIKRALKRGVEVEIMIPAKSDIGFTPETGELVAYRLMKKGAKVYLFDGGFHHSKVMMVDSTFCTVGTANLDSRSLRYDYETNAFIFDKGTTDELSTMFERDKQNSHLLTREYWKNRSGWKKFVGWFGNLLTPFL
jgi:cardiolipin synthase